MRLIDADVLIKDLEEYKVDMSNAISEDELYINGYDAGLHTSICAVIEAVTIDAVPVVHGHWGEPQRDGCITYDKNAYRQCSVCGNRQFLGMQMNYCSHCGAKMDEVVE